MDDLTYEPDVDVGDIVDVRDLTEFDDDPAGSPLIEDPTELQDALEALKDIQRLSADLESLGGVSAREAKVFRQLTIGLESADAHFARYPLASYTRLASQVNYRATQEGVISSSLEFIRRAMKAAIKFIKDLLEKIWWKLIDRRKAVRAVAAKQTQMSKFFGELYANSNRSRNSIPEIIGRLETELIRTWNQGSAEATSRTSSRTLDSAVRYIDDGLAATELVANSLLNGSSDANLNDALASATKSFSDNLTFDQVKLILKTSPMVPVKFEGGDLSTVSFALEQEYDAIEGLLTKLVKMERSRKEMVKLLNDLDKGLMGDLLEVDPVKSAALGNILGTAGSRVAAALELANRDIDSCQRLSKQLGSLATQAMRELKHS